MVSKNTKNECVQDMDPKKQQTSKCSGNGSRKLNKNEYVHDMDPENQTRNMLRKWINTNHYKRICAGSVC